MQDRASFEAKGLTETVGRFFAEEIAKGSELGNVKMGRPAPGIDQGFASGGEIMKEEQAAKTARRNRIAVMPLRTAAEEYRLVWP